MMSSFLIALVIVSLAYGARSSIRTLRSQMAADPRAAALLLVIGGLIIVAGLWR
jgi:hypothetical protein